MTEPTLHIFSMVGKKLAVDHGPTIHCSEFPVQNGTYYLVVNQTCTALQLRLRNLLRKLQQTWHNQTKTIRWCHNFTTHTIANCIPTDVLITYLCLHWIEQVVQTENLSNQFTFRNKYFGSIIKQDETTQVETQVKVSHRPQWKFQKMPSLG